MACGVTVRTDPPVAVVPLVISPPRLRVKLALLVVGAALSGFWVGYPKETPRYDGPDAIALAGAVGIALATLGISWPWRRRRAFPPQPGH